MLVRLDLQRRLVLPLRRLKQPLRLRRVARPVPLNDSLISLGEEGGEGDLPKRVVRMLSSFLIPVCIDDLVQMARNQIRGEPIDNSTLRLL